MDIINYLPGYFRKSKAAITLIEVIEKELARMRKYRKYLMGESRISTTVDYISEHEKAVGITPSEAELVITMGDYTVEELYDYTVEELSNLMVSAPNDMSLSQSPELRRANIKVRLRGSGTVDEELIKRIAESYTDGDVEVTCVYSDYIVYVNFVSKTGRPAAIDEIMAAIKAILPAHLKLDCNYRRRTWVEVAQMGTWGETLSGNTWEYILNSEVTENG